MAGWQDAQVVKAAPDWQSAAIINPSNDNPDVDESTGAPASVRAVVGAMPDDPKTRLVALQKFFPDAKIVGADNFVYTDPKTGKRRLYNPKGLDLGDLASLAPEVAELAGGTGGAIGGAAAGTPGGPAGIIAGGIAGAGAGATAAKEAVQRAAMKLSGVDDQRTTRQQIKDAATTAAFNAAGEGAGKLVAAGGKAIIKGLARGGAKGRAETQQAIDDLEKFGSTPSAAQATQNAALDTIESFTGKVPGGAGVIRQAAQRQSETVAAGMDAKIAAMNRGVTPDDYISGKAVISGIDGFVKNFSDKADVLYGKLDGFLPAAHPVQVSNTQHVLTELATPTPGAANVSATLANPALVKLGEALGKDATGGALPYGVMKDLRSSIGRRLGTPQLHDDIPRAQLKQVYAALTSDLRAAAQQQGPGATKAFDRANTFYKAGIDRMDKMLDPLLRNRVPEQAYAAFESSAKQGPSRIMALRRSVTPDQWNAITGSVVDRLGRAKPGYQGVERENFSFQNFLANWQRLPDRSKDVLFSGPGMGTMRADLDGLARASDRIRVSSKAFANPSGTGGVAMGGAMILGAIASTLTGHFGAGAGLAAAIPSANGAAHLLTNPKFVRWLAQSTKIQPAGIGAHIGRLGAIAAESDPATRDAILGVLGGLQNTPDEPDTVITTGEHPQ